MQKISFCEDVRAQRLNANDNVSPAPECFARLRKYRVTVDSSCIHLRMCGAAVGKWSMEPCGGLAVGYELNSIGKSKFDHETRWCRL